MARAKKSLTPNQLFFFEHGGYSYDVKTETAEQGRRRCAIAMADAEEKAKNLGWHVGWSDDWTCGSHVKEFGEDAYSEEPATCEAAILVDADGKVLASLGCIDDASPEYRRVIEAELASDALVDYDREIEILDAH